MKRLLWALLAASGAAHAGQWTAHHVIPFGPLAACQRCTAVPGQITITWDTPAADEAGNAFAVDHYVLVYEQIGTYDVSFIEDIRASANRYTLTGLASGEYAAWLEARGADGNGDVIFDVPRC